MRITLPTKRRLVQVLAAILLTSNVVGFSMGNACIPVLWCSACSMTWLGCPVGMLADSIAFHEIPWLVLGVAAGSAVLVGRWFCGWVCPVGLVQDLLYKLPGRKFMLPSWTRFLKYAVLLFPVAAVAWFLGRDHALAFCQWCPAATATVAIPVAIGDGTIAFDWHLLRMVVLAVLIGLAVMSHRPFCRMLCPVGALVALASIRPWLSIRMDTAKCKSCKVCDRRCPMDVRVEAKRETGGRINRDAECIACLTCEAVCTKAAIHNNSRILGR